LCPRVRASRRTQEKARHSRRKREAFIKQIKKSGSAKKAIESSGEFGGKKHKTEGDPQIGKWGATAKKKKLFAGAGRDR